MKILNAVYIKTEVYHIAILCPQYDKEDKVVYVKLHAPWSVLTAQAEIMNMKMPLAVSLFSSFPSTLPLTSSLFPHTSSFSNVKKGQ